MAEMCVKYSNICAISDVAPAQNLEQETDNLLIELKTWDFLIDQEADDLKIDYSQVEKNSEKF
jgi:hypothetical protein